MDRRVAFILAALSPAGLAFSAFAQQGYPVMPAYSGYAPAMPMQAAPGYAPAYAPGYGMYGQPAMPVMAVPVPYPVVVTQPVPMFGALETMPANGPLGGPAAEPVAAQKTVEHVTAMKPKTAAPVAEKAKTPPPVAEKAKPAATAPAKPTAPASQAQAQPEVLGAQAQAQSPGAPPAQAQPAAAPANQPKPVSRSTFFKFWVHEDTN